MRYYSYCCNWHTYTVYIHIYTVQIYCKWQMYNGCMQGLYYIIKNQRHLSSTGLHTNILYVYALPRKYLLYYIYIIYIYCISHYASHICLYTYSLTHGWTYCIVETIKYHWKVLSGVRRNLHSETIYCIYCNIVKPYMA